MCHYAPLHQTIKYPVDQIHNDFFFVIFLPSNNWLICNEFEWNVGKKMGLINDMKENT